MVAMMPPEDGCPADEWQVAEWIAKVNGLQQYEVVSIDDQGAEIRYLPDEVGRALTECHREAVVDFEQLLEEGAKDDPPDATPAEIKHADLGAMLAQLPEPPPPDPHWQDRVLDAIDRDASLDGVDQTEPVQPDEEVLVEHRNGDDEATHVGVVDARFDTSEPEDNGNENNETRTKDNG